MEINGRYGDHFDTMCVAHLSCLKAALMIWNLWIRQFQTEKLLNCSSWIRAALLNGTPKPVIFSIVNIDTSQFFTRNFLVNTSLRIRHHFIVSTL